MTDPVPLTGLGAAALAYARLGWRVFTLYPRDKKPMNLCAACLERLPRKDESGVSTCRKCQKQHHDGRDGTPHELGLYVATTDPALIERWWRKEPRANIGIRCGDGLFVLDVDVPNPEEGKTDDGEASLAKLIERHAPLPETPRQRTGEYKQKDDSLRRGQQYAFKVEEPIRNSASKLGPGLDVRGDGGYIVAAPSIHPSGAKYEWDPKPSKTPLAPIPAWLLNLAKGERKLSEVASAKGPPKKTTRPNTLPSAAERWVNAALDGEYDRAANAPKGSRNSSLNVASFKLGQLVGGGCLEVAAARATLEAAAEASGWAGEEGADAVNSVIESGMAAGMKVPRSAPEEIKVPEREPYQPPQQKRAALRVAGGTHVPQPEDAVADPKKKPQEKPVTKKGWAIEGWEDYVEFKPETRILVTNVVKNGVALLLYRTEYADLFVLNKRSRKPIVTRKPMWTNNGGAYPRVMVDEDVIGMRCEMEGHGLRLNKGEVLDAIRLAAKEREIDPIGDKLASFVWDGKERLDHWLSDLMGAEETGLIRAFGAKWMIAAVARIMEPGCKFDHVLILEGPQRLGKSTALYLLGNALDPYAYTDRLSKIDSKDSMIELVGPVIIELAELSVLKHCDDDTKKGFLSRRYDDVRLPWDKGTTRLDRGCVFAGTVNDDEYLSDPTGESRYWPVAVTDIKLSEIAEQAPQLWAEARERYRAGERWWLEDQVLIAEAAAVTATRAVEDVWAKFIDDYIEHKTWVTIAELLKELGVSVDKMDRRPQQRVAHHLRRRGWRRTVLKRPKNIRAWVPGAWAETKQRGDLFDEVPAHKPDEAIPFDDPGPEER